MTTVADQWCVLKEDLEVGGEQFRAGERFRVASRRPSAGRELLTLDGNDDQQRWTCRRVAHGVSSDQVLFESVDAVPESYLPSDSK